MDRQAESAPLQTSFVLSTQFPCPPPPSGQQRGSMTSPPQSLLPPRPPNRPTTTRQHIEFQNFNPGPMLPPQSPVFGSFTPMSSPTPSSSWLLQGFQSAPPVAYHNVALPPHPFSRPPYPSASTHGMASYGDYNSAGSPSMDAMKMFNPEPTETPIGVNYYSNEGYGAKESGIGEPSGFMNEYVGAYKELDKLFDFSIKNDDVEIISSASFRNKREAATNSDVLPPRRVRRKSADYNHLNNGNPTTWIGKWGFTASQMDEIARSDTLRNQVLTDPKYVKRTLANRETSRRTNQRNAQHILGLEKKVETLAIEVGTVAAHTRFAERTNLGLEEDNKQMRIRIREMEEQAVVADALTERYNGEISRLKQKGTREVIPNRETTMDDDMWWEKLKLFDEEQQKANYCGLDFE